MIGCTKQNVLYWSKHSHSTQSRKSIYKTIQLAADVFGLSEEEAELFANSAGLSFEYEEGKILEKLEYQGKINQLCRKAMISDRMLRVYKYKTPTKQTLLALTVAMNKNSLEIDNILRKFGYCLSESILCDVVVRWYVDNCDKNDNLLFQINETLENMGISLLMTQQI